MLTDLEALVALNALPKIGPVKVRRLVDCFGSAQAILTASAEELIKVDGLGPKIAEIVTQWQDYVDVTSEITQAKQRGLSLITQQDDSYPKSLLEIFDPPLILYVWGELLPVDDHGIAIVGSRKHTHYGQQSSRQLAFQLASAGTTVISGLARGIDTFAHEGAIAAGGRTIAVIGSGLGQIYPPENMQLAEKIAEGNGAVVSEFPLNQKPDKKTFPMRNRIVAGWSTGVLVVECPKWSGSLITANLAIDNGKPIYAVPGQIDSPSSSGCNELIRNGATLVTTAEDILQDREILPLFDTPVEKSVNPAILNLSDVEKRVYNCLSNQSILLDEIVAQTSLPVPQVSVTLIQLEIKKLIQQLPGQQYVLRSDMGF